MNGKQAKKIRKETSKQVKYELGDLINRSIKERIIIAFKIIFKYKIITKSDGT